MDFSTFDYSLRWPKDLFIWEARRIRILHSELQFTNMVSCLFAEAFTDSGVDGHLEQTIDQLSTAGSEHDASLQILDALLADPNIMHEFKPARYWFERQRRVTVKASNKTLASAFVDLITEFCEFDYFPRILPKPCVDDSSSLDADPSARISRAIHMRVAWPLDESPDPISDDLLYSVIEYFYDQAQRPRTRFFHSYADCGWHYSDHNHESGAAVYRWRVNELLDRYQTEYRLGKQGPEKGRLIRHADLDLDDLAGTLIAATEGTDDDKIAANIRLYRLRESNAHEKRAAIAQLAGILERYRKQSKGSALPKGDESDLFNIFNNFSIRHDNAQQKGDYGDEYLDWIFWTTLAAIQLLKQIEIRPSKQFPS